MHGILTHFVSTALKRDTRVIYLYFLSENVSGHMVAWNLQENSKSRTRY